MSNIKEKPKKNIKLFDKGVIATEKTKEVLQYIKKKSEPSDENANEQSIDYLKDVHHVISKHQSKKIVKKHKKRLNESNNKIKEVRRTFIPNKIKSKFQSNETVNNQYNKAKNLARKKLVFKGKKTFKKKPKKISKFFNMLKVNLLKIKSMILVLGVFGVIALVLILVVSLIALLVNSVFGIFFSSESMGNEKTISQVVNEIKVDLNNKIVNIQNTTPHDDYEIISNMAEWEDVLALYTVKVANGKVATEVVTMDDKKANTLKSLFWQMNVITSSVGDKKTEDGRNVKMLTIKIDGKSPEEVMNQNMFNFEQKKQYHELTNEKYKSLWKDVIFGKSSGNSDMVEIAKKEIGNHGGQKYWSWYGFKYRVEWCAIFVSWVADQAGVINNIVPRFSSCANQGIPWFKSMSKWRDRGYVPKEGDIIFFDWEQDGRADHVGIVEKVEDDKIYTIEGNSGNQVKSRNYKINSRDIYGYGLI